MQSLPLALLLSCSVCLWVGCRTDQDSNSLNSNDQYLEPDSQNMNVDLDLDEDVDSLCSDTGTTEHYYLRPADGEEFPIIELKACIDEKFNLKGLDITVDQSNRTRSTVEKETVAVHIPTEYIAGLFDKISFQDSNQKKIDIVKDYETNFELPGFPEIQFYYFTIADASPILMYQSNVDDLCPRDWFASEEAHQRFQSVETNFIFDTYMCQASTADGTTGNLPLWMRFDLIPETLDQQVKPNYRFMDLKTTSHRRNFRNEVIIGDAVHFVDSAINSNMEGEIDLYPSRIRSYKLEASSDPCDLNSVDAEICISEDQDIKWSYTFVRECVTSLPTGNCEPGELRNEHYCHEGQWRCRFQQLSEPSFQALQPVGKGKKCEFGEEDLFLPQCQSGLTCEISNDEFARCQ